MSQNLSVLASLTEQLQIEETKYKKNKSEENFGYKCKGKGHTLFDGCVPEKIQLFLEYREEISNSVLVPISTLLTQFVLNYAGKDVQQEKQDLLSAIFFISLKTVEPAGKGDNAKSTVEPTFQMKKCALSSKSRFFSRESLNNELSNKELDIAKNCVLPALFIPQYDLCITGLCSVLRYLLQHSHSVKEQNSPLLGFQNACLSAPAEVSLWTRFCEIDLPKATKSIQNITIDSITNGTLSLSEEFAKFEMHLSQPIRMFNIRKRMQKAEKTKETNKEVDVQKLATNVQNEADAIKKFALTQHVYAEGPDYLLSDIILFLHYYISFYASPFTINIEKWEKILPKTVKWFNRVTELGALEVAQTLITSTGKCIDFETLEITLPSVPEQSLYKSDPNRHNTASRIHTRSNKGK